LSARLYGPNVDRHVFPDQPLAVIQRRGHSAMPVIVGDSSEETMQFVGSAGPVVDAGSYASAREKVFGAANASRILARYPIANGADPRAAFVRLTTDAFVTCPSRRVAAALAALQTAPVYRYLFRHALENDPQIKALGAVHTLEHAFLFVWQGSYRPTATDLNIQQHMLGYWTNMAKSGSPGTVGNRAWPAYTAQNEAYLQIAPSFSAQTGPADAHCALWNSVQLPWPHL
jgi:para-nitrobenzyl esterase